MTTQLAPTPIFKAFDNVGLPLAFGKLYTYQAGTTTPQATYTDSTGNTPNPNPITLNARGETPLWLNPTLNYKFLLTDALGNQIPGWPVDNINGSLYPGNSIIPNTSNAFTLGSPQFSWANGYFGPNCVPVFDPGSGAIGYWPRTAAEIAAGVTPTNYAYAPGDLRRYGTFVSGGGDVTTALANACAQAQKTGGAPVYIPSAMGALTVTAGAPTITVPITVYGDGRESSIISTSNDITVFNVSTNGAAPGCTFRDFNLQGRGRTVSGVNPGIKFTNSPYNSIIRCRVQNFAQGVHYATGANSSYLNSIIDSEIDKNNAYNIYAESQTHQLTMHKVTFGSSYAGPAALYLTDSSCLSIIGGDCEANGVGGPGTAAVAIDLDNAANTKNGGHFISGVDFETNALTAAEIRIGNTNLVPAVTVTANVFSFGATTPYVLSMVNASGVTFSGNDVQTGYGTGVFNFTGAMGFRSFCNYQNNGFGAPLGDFAANIAQYQSQIASSESAGSGVAIDASKGNQFIVTVTDNTAFAVNAPSNAAASGQQITITIRNTSGGALGSVTWNSAFKGPQTLWVSPANGFSRSVQFQYNGTNWVQIGQTAADVPN